MILAHECPKCFSFQAKNLSEAPAGFQANAPRYAAGDKSAFTKDKIAPDLVKAKTVDKVDAILRQATPAKKPQR